MDSRRSQGNSELLLKSITFLIVIIAVVLWPEKLNPISLVNAILITVLLLKLVSREYCEIFIRSFISSYIFANIIYFILSPQGIFDSIYLDGNASDSQYYLAQARSFILDHDISVLYSTWGSLIPISYGVFALELFGQNYIGIIFLNSLLYTTSIFWAASIFEIPRYKYKTLSIVSFMPLQIFMNSMLSKEVIYLFLIIGSIYFYKKLSTNIYSIFFNLVFSLFIILIIIFRPSGAIILFLVFILIGVFQKNKIRNFIKIILLLFLLGAFSYYIIENLGYRIPLFFLNDEGSVDFTTHEEISEDRISSHAIPNFAVPYFSPPWSILFSPILAMIWMISPLPFFGLLLKALGAFLTGNIEFNYFAVIIRYFDSLFMIYFLINLFNKFRVQNLKKINNPLIIFFLIQVFNIAVFQFFESGRHRYLPGFILIIFTISFLNKKNINI